MSDVVIRAENLGKKYRIKHQQQRQQYVSLRDVIAHRAKSLFRNPRVPIRNPQSEEDFWALKDVSFEIKQGEVVGIIGRNGAGKSTLLKILSRITEPTNGRIGIKGRVASLLEVGTGFHPELTGRENIYLNGAILGMSREEIKRKFDEIVAFAEVEQFLDTPVKRYSSGMYVRLAFAVAAHLEPEILIIDEVLAVGDAQFQKKCLGKMNDVAREGRTVLFVSHNMGAVRTLCQRGLYISEGAIERDTAALDAVRLYTLSLSTGTSTSLKERQDRHGDGRIRLTAFWLENANGQGIERIVLGQSVRFCFAFEAVEGLENVYFAFDLQEQFGEPVINCNTGDLGLDFARVPQKGIFICTIERFPLRGARYLGNVFCAVRGIVCDWIQAAIQVDVVDGDFYGTGEIRAASKVALAHGWNLLAS